jgi:hypothetical protein
MRVLEIINESKKQQQIDELDLKKVGTAVGKGVSAATQGIGAVAGGVAGLPKAFKKGFQAGKDVVGGSDSNAKNRTFQYTDPKTNAQSTVSVDDSGVYYKADAKTGAMSPVKDPAELSNIKRQDPSAKTKTTAAKSSSGVASTTAASTTATVNPEKLSLKQIKQAVDKMRKRDRDSLLTYLQSKNTATTANTAGTTAPAKPALTVAV